MAESIFQIGDNIKAYVTINSWSEGSLQIVGTGEMYDVENFICLSAGTALITFDNWQDCVDIIHGNVTIPDGIVNIPDKFFYSIDYIPDLQTLYIGKDVESIGKNAFYGGSHGGFRYIKSYSTKLKSLGDYCFQNCSNLVQADFNGTVTDVGQRCFADCTNVISLNLSKDIGIIKAGTFGNCYKLQSFNDGNIINYIEISSDAKANGIFDNCRALDNFTIADTCIFDNNDIGFNAYFLTDLNTSTTCNDEGLQITQINTNNIQAIAHDWINLDNRYPVFVQGKEFLYVAHQGNWIKIRGYNNAIGKIPISHEQVYLWIRALEAHSDSETPIFVAHNGKWLQIGY